MTPLRAPNEFPHPPGVASATAGASAPPRDDVAAALLDTTSALVFGLDPGGTIVAWNRALAVAADCPAEAVLGHRLSEVMARLGWAPAPAGAVLSFPPPARWECTWRRPDGDRLTVWETRVRRSEPGGGPLLVVMTGQDVTEQRAALDVLSRNEERFAALVEHSADLVVVLDGEGCIQYVTPAVERIFGATPAQLLGRPALEVVHPARRAVASRLLPRLLEPGGRPLSFPLELLRADGSPVAVEVTSTNLLDRPAVGGVVLNVRDVTERRAAEHALEGEQRFLEALLESLHDGIIACNAEGEITLVNKAATEMHDGGASGAGRNVHEFNDGIFTSDGRRPLSAEDGPLCRSLRGEEVRDFPFVITGQRGTERHCRASGQRITDGAGRVLGAVIAVHDVTKQVQAEADLTRQALHDPLTGLPNRARLLDRMRMALAAADRAGTGVAVLFLDLDHFKVINDSLGHDVGDHVLQEVAARLQCVLRAQDTAARLGGDEFVVLCEGLRSDPVADATAVASRIEAALLDPIDAGGHQVRMSASMGISFASRGARPSDLLRDADTAMYRAKAAGRAQHRLFDETLRAHAIERLEIEQDLRGALGGDGLRLVYQPIVAVGSGDVVAVEALVRWDHPRRGTLVPPVFIPVAEESGLITALGEWVLRGACAQVVEWRRETGRRIVLNANVSARQLVEPVLVERIESILATSGLAPADLCLEITESVLMERGATVDTLLALHELGVELAIDDFGTGYSSLGYIRNFPFRYLKIDKSFVRGMLGSRQDRAIVAAVVELAATLGLESIAEGVEAAAELELLGTLGCPLAQGFHLGRPTAPEVLGAVFRSAAATGQSLLSLS